MKGLVVAVVVVFIDFQEDYFGIDTNEENLNKNQQASLLQPVYKFQVRTQ